MWKQKDWQNKQRSDMSASFIQLFMHKYDNNNYKLKLSGYILTEGELKKKT